MSVAQAAHTPESPRPSVVRDAAVDWVKFDAVLARDGSVDPVDKALYAALASFVPASPDQHRTTGPEGHDAPTRRVLAACIGRSVDTVDRATKRLEERGLVEVERRRDPDNPRRNVPSVYRLLDHERWDERAAERAARRKAQRRTLAAPVRPPSPQPCGQVAADMRPGGSRTSAAVPLPSKKTSLSEGAKGASRPDTPAADERETGAAPTTTAERVIRAAAVVSPGDEAAFTAWITARHTPRGPGWWRTTAANGDLPDLAQTWRTEHAPAATGPALPAWCGQCGDGMPAAQYNPKFRRNDGRACPDCHPDRHAA